MPKRRDVKNLRLAKILNIILLQGPVNTSTIALELEKIGVKRKTALNMVSNILHELEEYSLIKSEEKGKLKYYDITARGILILLLVVRSYNIRKLINTETILKGIIRRKPELMPYIQGYLLLKEHLKLEEGEEEGEEDLLDGIGFALYLEKTELYKLEVESWDELVYEAISPLTKYIKEQIDEEGELTDLIEYIKKLKPYHRTLAFEALLKAIENLTQETDEEIEKLKQRKKILKQIHKEIKSIYK